MWSYISGPHLDHALAAAGPMPEGRQLLREVVEVGCHDRRQPDLAGRGLREQLGAHRAPFAPVRGAIVRAFALSTVSIRPCVSPPFGEARVTAVPASRKA